MPSLLRAHRGWMWNRAFPGAVDEVRHVRSAVRSLLDGCPAAEDVVQVLSELSANAVAHSRSGRPGGKFIVRLRYSPGDCVWGEVEDEGSSWDGDLAASARHRSGLFIVLKLTSACAVADGSAHHRVVGFRIQCRPECAEGCSGINTRAQVSGSMKTCEGER
jgi:anti-sigma regulatory factor (Ser/Thr protein kinase)